MKAAYKEQFIKKEIVFGNDLVMVLIAYILIHFPCNNITNVEKSFPSWEELGKDSHF